MKRERKASSVCVTDVVRGRTKLCTDRKGGFSYHLRSKKISRVFVWTKISAVNVYCPEWPPGGTIGHPGGQQKKFLPFGHGRDLVAFNGTGL